MESLSEKMYDSDFSDLLETKYMSSWNVKISQFFLDYLKLLTNFPLVLKYLYNFKFTRCTCRFFSNAFLYILRWISFSEDKNPVALVTNLKKVGI